MIKYCYYTLWPIPVLQVQMYYDVFVVKLDSNFLEIIICKYRTKLDCVAMPSLMAARVGWIETMVPFLPFLDQNSPN